LLGAEGFRGSWSGHGSRDRAEIPDPARGGGLALALLKGEGAVRQLDATYFDTADHALRKAGFGLRVRDGEGGRKQTLKSASAGGVFSRGEWEEAIAGPDPDRDALARTPAAAMLDGEALAPVFTTRVERTVRLVQVGEAVIEAALDRGELSADGRRAAVCELELELKSARPGRCSTWPGTSPSASRCACRWSARPSAATAWRRRRRGLAPSAGRGAGPEGQRRRGAAGPWPGGPGPSLRGLEALRDRPEPDGVHQARVAAGALRALLKIFKPLAQDEPPSGWTRSSTGWPASSTPPAISTSSSATSGTRPPARRSRAAMTSSAPSGRPRQRLSAHGGGAGKPRARDVLLEAAAWLESGAWTTDPHLAEIRDGRADAFAARVLDHRRKQVKRRAKTSTTSTPKRAIGCG
jgi:triphosphatase